MGFVWTASKIDDATYCPRLYYYKHVRKLRFPINASMALGIFMHRAMEKYFYNGEGKPKYKSAESFANICKARWKRFVAKGKIRGQEISWSKKEEPYIIAETILPEICRKVYDIVAQEDMPLFREAKFDFVLDGRRFKGKIDYITKRDGKVIVRDYKSGRRKPGNMKLDFDPQFTLYFLAVASLCHGDKRFAQALKVDDEARKKWAGNPEYLPDMIEGEYFFMREGEIFPIRREAFHYYDFCNMLEGLESMIRRREFAPQRGRLCDYCLAQNVCREETELTKEKLRYRQLFIFQAPQLVSVGEARKKIRQLRLKWGKTK